MKIAFVGKGGSGKTTLSSLFIRHLAATGAPVVAVDADINQHLGPALGLDEAEAAAEMIKTTPPGEGSRLLRVREDNPVYEACARPVELDGDVVRLMVPGPFTD